MVLLGAPEGFEQQLAPLPKGVQLRRQAQGPAQVVLLFARSQVDLEQHFPEAAGVLAEGGRLWITWPKKSSGAATDLTQITVRAFGLAAGLVDLKVSAIDETWSGLCFARRRA